MEALLPTVFQEFLPSIYVPHEFLISCLLAPISIPFSFFFFNFPPSFSFLPFLPFLPFLFSCLGARDFLARLLEDPEHRLSAVEALEHPWLNASWQQGTA